MEPHKTIISLRMKTHAVDNIGQCLPPATKDSGVLLFEIKGITKNDVNTKTEEFLNKVKQWIIENK